MLANKLGRLHEEVCTYFPFIGRIAVALYDSKAGDIKTFLSSPLEKSPLTQYRTALSNATWLNDLRRSRKSRVINEMNPSVLGDQRHSRLILAAGFKASYTVPVFEEATFLGYIFFDSFQSNVFTDRVIRQLDLFARLLSLMIENALRSVKAAAYLREAAGIQFDSRCVEIFLSRTDEITNIMNRFSEQSSETTSKLGPHSHAAARQRN